MNALDADDADVLATVLRTVGRARAAAPAFAGTTAPLRTDQLAELLAAAGCRVEVFPFLSSAVAMTLPRFGGVHPIFLNRSAERIDRVFALRHELAHVLAGDVEGAVFLTDDGVMSAGERAADLFALADLVPGWWLAWVARHEPSPEELAAEVAQAVAEFAEEWPAERTLDRARLRLRLFRECGI